MTIGRVQGKVPQLNWDRWFEQVPSTPSIHKARNPTKNLRHKKPKKAVKACESPRKSLPKGHPEVLSIGQLGDLFLALLFGLRFRDPGDPLEVVCLGLIGFRV